MNPNIRTEATDIARNFDAFMKEFHPIEYSYFYTEESNFKKVKYTFMTSTANTLIELDEPLVELLVFLKDDLNRFSTLYEKEPLARYKLAICVITGLLVSIRDFITGVNLKPDFKPHFSLQNLEKELEDNRLLQTQN